jgi:hypothetical protein
MRRRATMKCKIVVQYLTGDSFSTYDREEELEGRWENTEVIEENLNRIQEHYFYYCQLQRSLTNLAAEKLRAEAKDKDWWADNSFDEFRSIKLKLDDGREYVVGCFWIGYFETLKEVAAVLDLPSKQIRRF